MALAFKRTEPKTNFAELSKMIHGFVKTGKTTLASKMIVDGKEPLFVATEDGHHNLAVYAHRIQTWEAFKNFTAYCEKNADEIKAKFSCFVIDLVSDLAEMCEQYVKKSMNIKDLSDAEWGKGHKAFRLEFKGEVQKIWAILPINFIAHSKEKELEIEGVKIKQQAPSMSASVLEFVNGKVDMVGFIVPATKTKGENPLITFRPSKMAMAGSRIKHIAREFELNINDMQSSYDAIQAAFAKGGG